MILRYNVKNQNLLILQIALSSITVPLFCFWGSREQLEALGLWGYPFQGCWLTWWMSGSRFIAGIFFLKLKNHMTTFLLVQIQQSQPFNSSTFSKYFALATHELLGEKINLQIVRRIFIYGIEYFPNLSLTLALFRLPWRKWGEGWPWVFSKSPCNKRHHLTEALLQDKVSESSIWEGYKLIFFTFTFFFTRYLGTSTNMWRPWNPNLVDLSDVSLVHNKPTVFWSSTAALAFANVKVKECDVFKTIIWIKEIWIDLP